MNFFEILKVLVLGIVEGFTEWLPISSTGHMILVDEIIHLNVSEAFREVFMVVIQLGAILAVVVLYFHKLNPFSPRKTQNQKRATIRLWMKIVVACIPAAVIGLPFDNLLDKLMNGYVVSAITGEQKPRREVQDSAGDADFLPDGGGYRTVPGACHGSGNLPFRGDHPGSYAAWLLQRSGGGIFFLPGNSSHVRSQPLKDCEIYHRGGFLPDV